MPLIVPKGTMPFRLFQMMVGPFYIYSLVTAQWEPWVSGRHW